MKNTGKAILLAVVILAGGCTLADVKVEVVSERTSLENQILGTYNALDREMLLVASVRGVDSEGRIRKPVQHSQEHKDAVTAMQIQAFHADDVNTFKQIGWVGENSDGLLTVFPISRENIAESLKPFVQRYTEQELNSVISQINESREIIMRRMTEMNENLSEADMPKIRRIFGKFNTENAEKGVKIQTPDGSWSVKQ